MELRRYLAILRQRLLLIVLTVTVAAVAGYLNTDHTQVYTAQSTIYIGASQFSVDASRNDISADRAAGLDRIISTYAAMIASEPIAQDAITLSGLATTPESVVARTTVFPKPGTNLLVVEVSDSDPVVAQRLSVGMAAAFTDKLKALGPGDVVGEGDVPSIPATIFERAKLPTVPTPVGTAGNIIVAAVFGLVLSCGVVLLIEYLDVTIKTGEDAERRLELPVLGVIPYARQEIPAPRPNPRPVDVDLAAHLRA